MFFSKNAIIALIVLTLTSITSISQATTNTDDIKIMSIAEIFANKDSLKGKMVQVKGKVVKVSHKIMKLNWIHITDGTGEKGTDEIIFRSKTEDAKVGSDIIAKGIVDTDLDFGSGYTYSILINDAVFSQ